MNKANEDDGIAAEIFQILKDDAVKVWNSICQQIWKTQQWPQNWKMSVFFPIPKRQFQRMFQLLHSFCMLIQLCSKSFKLGFISIWTENFQLYKLHFTEAEEPETSCQYLSDHGESKGIPEKYLVLLHWLCPLTVWITTNCGKFLKWWQYQTTLSPEKTAFRSWATVRNGHRSTGWLQIAKEVCLDCIFSPRLFNFYAEYVIWNARLDKSEARIKTAGRNINNLRYADDTILMADSVRN